MADPVDSPGKLEIEPVAAPLIERLLASWKAGTPIDLTDLLPPGASDSLVADVACRELALRLQLKQHVHASDYLERFPQLSESEEIVLYLIEAEILARKKYGPPPCLEEYAGRYPKLIAGFGRLFASAPAGELRVAGPFALVGRIAEGGMGVVYRAEDPLFRRSLAVKVMKRGMSAERFQTETELTARLQHPGIPPVHTRGTLPDGRPYLVMKLIEGQNLSQLLSRRDDASEELGHWLSVFEHVCQAVGYAHSQGVVHRDLKPQNVMVGEFGEVQVMDWGLGKELAGERHTPAKRESASPTALAGASTIDTDDPLRAHTTDASGGTRGLIGTLAYMAPEQADAERWGKVGTRADVFGLGAILCHMLTGEAPYPAKDLAELERQAREASLDDARRRLRASRADPELVAIAEACLQPNPTDRPLDGQVVARLVSDHRASAAARLKQAEAEATAASAREVAQRTRRKWQLALAAAVCTLVAAFIGGVWWRAEQRLKAESARDRTSELLVLAAGLQAEYRYAAAEDLLRQGAELAKQFAPDLVEAVARAKADLGFVRELDGIRMKRWSWIAQPSRAESDVRRAPGRYEGETAPRLYRRAFAARDLDVVANSVATAERVAASGIRADLLSALDDWAVVEQDVAIRDAVLAVLRRADPDSDADPFRDPGVRKDAAKLSALAARLDAGRLSPGAAVAISQVMSDNGLDAVPFLRPAQFAHPRDFLLAFTLGMALKPGDPERLAAFQTARTIRPDDPTTTFQLGAALYPRGDVDGAIAAYRETVRLDPMDVTAHNNLGLALFEKKKFDDAAAAYRAALAIDPDYALAHNGLGRTLRALGDTDGAIAAYWDCIRVRPDFAWPYFNLGNALRTKGDPIGAVAAYREAVAHDPRDAAACTNLGNALLKLGELTDAEAAFKAAIRIEPGNSAARDGLKSIDAARAKGLAKGAPDGTMSPDAHALKGLSLQRTGDIVGARAALAEAARLDSKRFAPFLQGLSDGK